MNIALVSDLHLEFEDYVVPHCSAEVLVLAGDVCVVSALNNPQHKLYQRFHGFFKRVSQQFNHVVYVLGNHEFYHGDFDLSIAELKRSMQQYNNIHVLECDRVEILDSRGVLYTFAGCTLWTDMNHADPLVQLELQYTLNDFKIIKHNKRVLSTISAHLRHQRSLEFLLECVGTYTKNLVVVTHHAPSFKSVHERYKHDFALNCGFASDLEQLVQTIEPQLWLHGHMHNYSDYKVNTTRVVCNPRGYPGENHNTYQPQIFEL